MTLGAAGSHPGTNKAGTQLLKARLLLLCSRKMAPLIIGMGHPGGPGWPSLFQSNIIFIDF